MNYNKILFIALALCLCVIAAPVSAEGMWNGDNWVDINHNDKCTKVVFNPQTGNTNCYNENVGSLADIKADANSYSGWADIIIRSHSNLMNPWLYLSNVLAPNVTETIGVNSDGLNRISNLAPGRYRLTLDNYDVPDETVEFDIAAGQMSGTQVVFIGQHFSGATACKPSYTILDAKYGASHCTDTVTTEVSNWYRHDYHLEYRYLDGTWVEGKKKYDRGYCDYSESEWSEWSDVFNQRSNSYGHSCIRMETRWAKHTSNCVTDGTVITVTQNVQTAVGLGATSSMFFDNAQNPGGIFGTGNTLLSEIKDPAVGIVKDVYIKYNNGCGLERTIKTKEYCNIDLVSGSATCPSQQTPN